MSIWESAHLKIIIIKKIPRQLESVTKNPYQCILKGIVHPKMKILSSFTHPQVVPNLYECLCSAEHKGRYSEECGKQSSSGAPLTSRVFIFSCYGSQWCPKTAWLQTFFRISSFVFSRTKTFIQVQNYLRMSKWWQNFHFGSTIPLTGIKTYQKLKAWFISFLSLNYCTYLCKMAIIYYNRRLQSIMKTISLISWKFCQAK